MAYAIPCLKVVVAKRLTDNLAVYTRELVAICLALHWVADNKPSRVVIASDSSSVLLSIGNRRSESRQDIVYEIMQ